MQMPFVTCAMKGTVDDPGFGLGRLSWSFYLNEPDAIGNFDP
jgi:hypothetical protein